MQNRAVAVLIVFFILFSLLPTGYELVNRNRLFPERSFELVHNFPTDYNFYLSRIREGLEGRTTVVERYTSEPHEGSFIQVFYLALGWLGRWWRVPWGRVGDIYHVARVVFGGFLLVMIAQYCRRAFFENRAEVARPISRILRSLADARAPSAQGSKLFDLPARFPYSLFLIPYSMLAFLLAVTASTWPKLVFYEGGWRFGGYMPWWSVMDSLQRITFIPHILVGQSLILALLLMLTNEGAMRRGGNWVFVGILGFALGIIFPPGLLFVAVVMGWYLAGDLFGRFITVYFEVPTGISKYTFVIGEVAGWIRKIALPCIVSLFIAVPALLYLKLMTSFYPWMRLVEVDTIRPLPFDYLEYFKAVGPILPLGLMGLFVAFVRREKAMMLAVAWVFAWLFLLFAFKFVPQQSPLRFSEMIPHVPLAVLTAYLFTLKKNRELRMENREKILHSSFFILPMILVIVGSGVMLSSWWWQRDFVDHKMRAAYPLVPTGSYVMYPLKDFLTAIRFIQDNTPADAIIFSETTAGNYIPAYGSRRVYLGHDNTVKYEEKQVIAKQFFSGNMKPDAARAFLNQNNLHYVFFGPQEKEDGARPLTPERSDGGRGVSDLSKVYSFLKEVYKNNFVTVYTTP